MLTRLHKTIAGYIKQLMIYYRSSWQAIAASNLQMLRLSSVLVLIFTALNLLIALSLGRPKHILLAYSVSFLLNACYTLYIYSNADRIRWRTRVIRVLCLLFLLQLLILAVFISSMSNPHEPGVFFAPMAIVFSMLFIIPFWQNVTLITGATAAFILLSKHLKDNAAFALDAYSAALTWALCLTADLVVMDLRLHGFHQHSELMRLSCTDSLTGLLNKTTVEAAARAYLSQDGVNRASALLVIDLDQFKQINDHMGHQAGDEALEVFGDSLLKLFRPQDIVGRIGGDEFVALMKNTCDPKLVARRAALICETVRQTRLQSPTLALTCSIGVAMCPDHGHTYDALFAKADEQLYRIKREGKNGYRIAK